MASWFMIVLVRFLLRLLADLGRFAALLFKPRQATAAENLILRRQIALFQERGIQPRRIDAATRLSLAIWLRCERANKCARARMKSKMP